MAMQPRSMAGPCSWFLGMLPTGDWLVAMLLTLKCGEPCLRLRLLVPADHRARWGDAVGNVFLLLALRYEL